MAVRGLVLDVNETLFSMAPLRSRFVAAGLRADQVDVWFAQVLRDGFALAATGTGVPFPELARHHLEGLLRSADLDHDDEVVTTVLAGFGEMTAHDDVPDGLRAAKDAGLTVATLTNGTAGITRRFLERAGLEGLVGHTLEALSSGVWKPAKDAYQWAAGQLGLVVGEAVLVAVHPWDVHGARSAGMLGAWLDRSGGARYPAHFLAPDVQGRTLGELVTAVVAGHDGSAT